VQPRANRHDIASRRYHIFVAIAAFHNDHLDFPCAVAAQRRGFFIFGRLEARDYLLGGVELDQPEAVECVGSSP
jgi:hypothetical protein